MRLSCIDLGSNMVTGSGTSLSHVLEIIAKQVHYYMYSLNIRLHHLRCEQIIVAQPRFTPDGGCPPCRLQVQKKRLGISVFTFLAKAYRVLQLADDDKISKLLGKLPLFIFLDRRKCGKLLGKLPLFIILDRRKCGNPCY